MNKMYMELNEIEDRIKDNRDLKEMEGFMQATNQHINTHMKAFETLKTSIMLVNQEAHDAVQGLSFYEPSEMIKQQ